MKHIISEIVNFGGPILRFTSYGVDWFLTFWEKAHYHESSVEDEEGNVTGYEFYTTRNDVVTFIPLYRNEDGSEQADG